MRYALLVFILTAVTGCRQSVTKLSAKIIDSDSMAINWFKGDGTMDTVVAVKIIKDKNTINQLAKMAGGYVTDEYKCGYDGSLHFFKQNQVVQDIEFRMNDKECMHFSFMLNGKPYTTTLNEEAYSLLKTLRQ